MWNDCLLQKNQTLRWSPIMNCPLATLSLFLLLRALAPHFCTSIDEIPDNNRVPAIRRAPGYLRGLLARRSVQAGIDAAYLRDGAAWNDLEKNYTFLDRSLGDPGCTHQRWELSKNVWRPLHVVWRRPSVASNNKGKNKGSKGSNPHCHSP